MLVTSHRRENFGDGLEGICGALIELTRLFPDLAVIYPVHPNPNVRAATSSLLAGRERIYLVNPLDYDAFCHVMATCRLILTDSGGIQEEVAEPEQAGAGPPGDERAPEAVETGAVRVVGTGRTAIVAAAVELLTDEDAYRRMAEAVNPYGDGHAARRIVGHLLAGRAAPLAEDGCRAGSRQHSRPSTTEPEAPRP